MPKRHFLFMFTVSASLVVTYAIEAATMSHETSGAETSAAETKGANQLIVTSTADQPESGFLTFREAIEQANLVNGSEISFDNALFSTSQTITLEQGEVFISSNVDIVGPGADLLTIDAGNQSRILNINDNSQSAKLIQITGITFAHGNADGKGGCIFSAEKISLIASVIKSCNSTADGGGVSTAKNGNLIENSLFINNTATNGGGLAHQSGNAGDNLVIGSTFTGNIGASKGGGIYILQSNGYQIVNSTFSGNMSASGAGVRLNSAAVIRNSTFVDNVGIGVFTRQNNMQNNIITGNSGGDCVFIDTGFDNVNNIDTDGSCDVEASNHLTVDDPMLEPLANFGGITSTHRPLPGSPVIDAADDLICPDTDQRGEPRPQDGDEDNDPVCDIGAVELTETEETPQEVIYIDSFDLFSCNPRSTLTNDLLGC